MTDRLVASNDCVVAKMDFDRDGIDLEVKQVLLGRGGLKLQAERRPHHPASLSIAPFGFH
jgi:hypothetical protein